MSNPKNLDESEQGQPTQAPSDEPEGRKHTGIFTGSSASDGGPHARSDPPDRAQTPPGANAAHNTSRSTWYPPPRRTSSATSKNGIRLYIAGDTHIGVSPGFVAYVEAKMKATLERLTEKARRGRELEARRLGRPPAPEIAMRHLAIADAENTAPPDVPEDQ